jgi:hypothetical protein
MTKKKASEKIVFASVIFVPHLIAINSENYPKNIINRINNLCGGERTYAVSIRVFTFSSIDSSFFNDVRNYFAAQICAAGVEQTPAPAK